MRRLILFSLIAYMFGCITASAETPTPSSNVPDRSRNESRAAKHIVVRRKPFETVEQFLRRQLPAGATKLVHHTPKPVKMRGREILVGVYRGGFDGNGNQRNQNDGSNQFAFAFVRRDKETYSRVPIADVGDNGGSRTEILAVFGARFGKSPERQLALLTKWDSRNAGGSKAMNALGVFYDVKVMRLMHRSSSPEFVQLRTPVIDQLGGCDCTHLVFVGDEKRVVRIEEAKARDVRGIRKQLRDLGIEP